jgi:hypothetical protein
MRGGNAVTRTLSWKLLTVLIACLLVAGTTAALDKPEVKTEEGFFQPETIEKANAIIRTLKEEFGKDLVVETFKSVPEHDLKLVKSMTARRMARHFQEWAQERADMLGVDGVYILLCKNPPYNQVIVSEDLQERGFSEAKRSAVTRLLPVSWSSRSRDTRFLEAVEKARKETILALQNEPPPAPAPTPSWLYAVYFAGGLLAVWFVVGLVRAVMGAGTPPTPAGAPGHVAASGGGVVGGVLGGMFGASLGYWLYQAAAGTSSAPPSTPPAQPLTSPPGMDELKRRAEALAARPVVRPDDRTLTHPGPGEERRDV